MATGRIEATKKTNYLNEVTEGIAQKGIDRQSLAAIADELDNKRDPRKRVALKAQQELWPKLGDIDGLTKGNADSMKRVGFSTRKEISDLLQDSTIFSESRDVPSDAEVALGEIRNQLTEMMKGPDSISDLFTKLLSPEADRDLQEATLKASRKLNTLIKGAEVMLRQAKSHHEKSATAAREAAREKAFNDDFENAWDVIESGEDELQFAEHAPSWSPDQQASSGGFRTSNEDAFPLPEEGGEDQMATLQKEIAEDPKAIDQMFGDSDAKKRKSPSRQRRARKSPRRRAA